MERDSQRTLSILSPVQALRKDSKMRLKSSLEAEHEKVRDLLIPCRHELQQLRQQIDDFRAVIVGVNFELGCEWGKTAEGMRDLFKRLHRAEADKKRLVELAKGNITGCGTCYTIIKEANLPEGAPRPLERKDEVMK
jgi:hypothetical protein